MFDLGAARGLFGVDEDHADDGATTVTTTPSLPTRTTVTTRLKNVSKLVASPASITCLKQLGHRSRAVILYSELLADGFVDHCILHY